jgi:hypothetical protein
MAEAPVRLFGMAEIEQHVLLVQLAGIAESIPVGRADGIHDAFLSAILRESPVMPASLATASASSKCFLPQSRRR